MPDWAGDLRPRLASLRLSPERERDIIDELSQHLDDRYDELRADGATDVEARRLAIGELRDHDALAAYMRPLRQSHVMPPIVPGEPAGRPVGDLWQDLRYAVRTLRKETGFTLAVVVTLALGIGANTAIFSLANATLFQRLPVEHRERLVNVYRGAAGGVFPYPMYAHLRDGNDSFEGFAAWGGISASFNAGDSAELVSGAIVTGNFFAVLGVHAAAGRLLSVSDDVTPGGHPVAVLGYDFWQSRFAGRPDVIGQEVRLNGHPFTIVGVTAAGFPGAQLGTVRNLYVPMMMQAVMRPPRARYAGEQNPDLLTHPTNSWLFGVARLKPGVAVDRARAQLEASAATYVRTLPQSLTAPKVPIVPIDNADAARRQQLQSVAWLLGGVVGAVLLISCANIANLLLSRSAARRRELAVRLAIGASRGRVVRQLLTESILLSLIGGAAGVALAWAVIQWFQAAPPPPGALPLALEFAIDRRVLAFSLGLSVLTGVIFGIAPALEASRPRLVSALKDASTGRDEGRSRVELKKVLVVAEVALSLMLLIVAGLFVRSLQSVRGIDPGFEAEKLVTAPLNINLLRYTSTQGREFYRQVVERMEGIPGIESASVARVAVLGGSARVLSIHVEGAGATHDSVMSEGVRAVTRDRTVTNANVIGPRYFRTIGVSFVNGRDFAAQDAEGSPRVVIVNETIAKMHFSGQQPIGKRISVDGQNGPWREIVGVVRDSKYGALAEEAAPIVYLPLSQNHETGMSLYVRASAPPETLIGSIRHEIQALEPNLPVPNIQTVTQTIGTSLYAARMGAWLLSVFGGLALLLAAVGIYGVLSFSIARRTREMGIRLALGADRRRVFALVVRDGMALVCVGIALGLGAGLAGTRSLAGFLYGISTFDAPTFVATIVVLTGVAFAACAIPARRATRVHPIAALRVD